MREIMLGEAHADVPTPQLPVPVRGLWQAYLGSLEKMRSGHTLAECSPASGFSTVRTDIHMCVLPTTSEMSSFIVHTSQLREQSGGLVSCPKPATIAASLRAESHPLHLHTSPSSESSSVHPPTHPPTPAEDQGREGQDLDPRTCSGPEWELSPRELPGHSLL